MESKARLVDVSTDWVSRKMRLTFELDTAADPGQLKDKDLRLSAVIWREKRSLDSNAYFHVLCQKMAEKLDTSLTEVKNHMLAEYGIPEIANGGLMTIIMRDDIEWQKLDTIHLRPTTAVRQMDDGKLYRVYYVMRGSHTFDTAEMSHLIHNTILEADALGIETATPDEIARMNALWGKKIEKETA